MQCVAARQCGFGGPASTCCCRAGVHAPVGRVLQIPDPCPPRFPYCSAVVKFGIPRTTVCPVTLTSGALPTFTVTAIKGSSSSPQPTDLRSAPSDSYTPQE